MHRVADERGMALVVALTTITMAGVLGVAVISSATQFMYSSARDSYSKRALAAAQAGLSVGLSRFSRIAASPSGAFSLNCITEREVAWVGTPPHCPATTGYFKMTGASSSYYLTADLGASLTGMPTVATECGGGGVGERCLTAIGTVNGVTRRVQERIHTQVLFNIHGLLGLRKVEVNSSDSWTGLNFSVTSDTGSNGAITYGANVTPPGSPYGCYLGPAGTAPAGCPQTRYSSAFTVPSVDTLPFAATAATNSDATIAAGYASATRSLTVAAGATLTLAEGDYNFCFVTLNSGATLQAATGARVKIYVDSASRSGSGCAQATGGKFAAGTIGGAASAKINPSLTAGQVEVYEYGTVAPPSGLASPPPATCNSDFTFVNGSSATSNNLYVYAPDSKVAIESNAYQFGAVVACEMSYWALSASARWDNPPTGISPSAGVGVVVGSYRECTPQFVEDPESGCG